jgi:hypothetical protein
MPRIVKSLKEQIREARLRVFELEEEYQTQLYLETMPDSDPLYKYCYSTSNFKIPYTQQSLDSWLRAVIKHMSARRYSHGGALTDAVVVSIPEFKTEAGIELWLEYVTKQLRTRVKKRKKQPE